MLDVIFVFLGLTLLVIGGEFLVRSSVALSTRLNISKLVIGLTVVSFATSAPELLVSIRAALEDHPDIALGNIIGSNIANIGLVLGITTIITPLTIDKDFYKLNWPVLLLLSVALYFVLKSPDGISRIDGFGFLLSLVVYLYLLISRARKLREKKLVVDGTDQQIELVSKFKIGAYFLIGSLSLYFGSELLIISAVNIANIMGISEHVIGVTMIAIGTSIPELAASVIAALRKESAISLGNLIGSNIFNIASVLGITAIIHPINKIGISQEIVSNDIFWMIGFVLLLIPIAFLPKRLEIGRIKGVFILMAYVVFISMVLMG